MSNTFICINGQPFGYANTAAESATLRSKAKQIAQECCGAKVARVVQAFLNGIEANVIDVQTCQAIPDFSLSVAEDNLNNLKDKASLRRAYD
jgi:hypothetical protein